MAITAVAPFLYPSISSPITDGSIGGTGSVTLNASGDRVGMVFQCPKAGTLDKAEFRFSTVTNNPDNGMRISFQTIDATTGFPDTVVDQFRDITGSISAGWAVPGLMTDDGTDTGVKRTVTAGEWIGVVVDFVNFVASDSIGVAVWTAATTHEVMSCYIADGSTGSYLKSSTQVPICVLKYDDGSYAIPVTGSIGGFPITSFDTTSYGTGSTPDEYAVRFQMPFACRVVGAWARLDANDDLDLVLYNGTTAERTASVDKDILRSTTPGVITAMFSSSYDISANTTYRMSIKPTTATTIQICRFTNTTAAVLAAIPGGSEWYESTRVDAGAWSDVTTSQPWGGIIIDGIDVGSGSGSGGSFTFIG